MAKVPKKHVILGAAALLIIVVIAAYIHPVVGVIAAMISIFVSPALADMVV